MSPKRLGIFTTVVVVGLGLSMSRCTPQMPSPVSSEWARPEAALPFEVSGNKVTGRSPTRGFAVELDDHGVALQLPQADAHAVGLALQRYGCPDRVQAVALVTPQVQAGRADYRRPELPDMIEWYMNRRDALEQGFTLARPPCGAAQGLIFELGLSGVTPRLQPDGAAVELRDPAGAPWLRYSDLKAYDATGRSLPSRLAVQGATIRLLIDDREAHYPVTVDPLVWLYMQKLYAFDGATGDGFGSAAALSGDTAVIGAPSAAVAGKPAAGAAYVFLRTGIWAKQDKLMATDAANNDTLGTAVAIAGDTIVVGAPRATVSGKLAAGAAYVFSRSGTTWTQQAKLTASDAASSDLFGSAVAITGDTVVIGARYAAVGPLLGAGAAYVFSRSGTTWTQQAKLTAGDAATAASFGSGVAIGADTAVVGAPGRYAGTWQAGAGYVFLRSGTTWTQQAKLTQTSVRGHELMGSTVSLSGESVAIGAAGPLSDGSYVFVRSGTTWTQQHYVGTAHNAALSGDTLAVAIPVANAERGEGYVLNRSGATWSSTVNLYDYDGMPGDALGTSVALDGSWLLWGAPGAAHGAVPSVGATVVYNLGMSKDNGAACLEDRECTSAHCVDGVCCNTACGTGGVDCLACSVATGAAVDGTCATAKLGTVCRAISYACDAAETCDGTATTCPSDKVAPAGTVCRAAAGVCDQPEVCNGSFWVCPADQLKTSGTVCRAAAGVCDAAESCDGRTVDCPKDVLRDRTTPCRSAVLPCDATEYCTGASSSCPADQLAAAGTVCRSARGPCDVAESCSGTSSACPSDVFQPTTIVCRAAAKDCDAVESCSGTSATCPSDEQSADGAACSVGSCERGFCKTEADLQVALTASPQSFHGQQPIRFTATVNNAGKGEALAVILALAHPPTAVLAELGGSGWGCQSATGGAACTLDKLAAAKGATLSLVLIPPPEQAQFNVSAQVKAGTPDPAPENNFVSLILSREPGPSVDLQGPGSAADGGSADDGPAPTPTGGCSYAQGRSPAPTAIPGAALALLGALALGGARRSSRAHSATAFRRPIGNGPAW